jgi:hypothetical protein
MSDQKKVNEEFHRRLQKQSHFQERTDERMDACERNVDEIHQQLRTITLKIEEPPQPAVINRHVRREVGFRPIEREGHQYEGWIENRQYYFHLERSVVKKSFSNQHPPWDDRRKRNVGPLQNEPVAAVIQLPNFAGDTDLTVFQRQCQVIAVHNRWTDEQLCMQILTHLKGKAADLLTYFSDITLVRLEELWDALFSRFGKHTSADAAGKTFII